MLMLHLHAGGLEMTLSNHSFLFASRTSIDSTAASVVADTVHGDIVNHCSVIDMNVGDPDVVDVAVVEKMPTSPVPAFIAIPHVAESIVDAAVETNEQAPIAHIPDITA